MSHFREKKEQTEKEEKERIERKKKDERRREEYCERNSGISSSSFFLLPSSFLIQNWKPFVFTVEKWKINWDWGFYWKSKLNVYCWKSSSFIIQNRKTICLLLKNEKKKLGLGFSVFMYWTSSSSFKIEKSFFVFYWKNEKKIGIRVVLYWTLIYVAILGFFVFLKWRVDMNVFSMTGVSFVDSIT